MLSSYMRSAPRAWLWASILLVIVITAGLVAMAMHAHRRVKHEQLVAALATDPPKMAQAVQSGTVSSHEANMATMQSEMQKMEQRVHGYFALPPGKPRQDYLDRLIDRVQDEVKAARLQSPPPPPPTTMPSRQEVVAVVENLSPAFKAQMAEFMRAMVERIKQRGIAMPGQ